MSSLKIDGVANTALNGTLSAKIDGAKNTLYTPTFKVAFDDLTQLIGSDYKVNDPHLLKLKEYTFQQPPLEEHEYTKEINRSGNNVTLKVEFKKDLPFLSPAFISTEPLSFNGKDLCCFRPDSPISLIYYKNEDDFAISITPKDETQEIIMCKRPFEDGDSLESLFSYLTGSHEYISLDINAKIKIPLIEVDWTSNHSEIKNRTLAKTPADYFEITDIQEQLKFSLTNIGAKVESVVGLAGKYNYVFPDNPQEIIFDKPFFVFLRKENYLSPYFAGYFADSSFLKPFDLTEINKENEQVYELLYPKDAVLKMPGEIMI
jgi:hypothetical protein